MRFAIQLDGGPNGSTDLQIDLAADATVGELADHLAAGFGLGSGLTVDDLDRSALVSEVGPRSGSVVTLRRSLSRPHRRDAENEAVEQFDVSPVRVIHSIIDGDPVDDAVVLHYGLNNLEGVGVRVTDRVEILTDGSARVLVDGQRVIGTRRVSDGDLISVHSKAPTGTAGGALAEPSVALTQSSCQRAFVVAIDSRLEPPSRGPFIPHRSSPRTHRDFMPRKVGFPTPPEAARLPGMPVLSAVVPLLLGAGLWVATRSILSAVFVLFSFVYVVASGIESRREFRKELEFREEQFHEGVDRAFDDLTEAHFEERKFGDEVCPSISELESIIATRGARLWERSFADSAGGALRVRLGTAVQRGSTPVECPSQGRPDLLDPLVESISDSLMHRLAVEVDLDRAGGLGLIAADETATDVARWVVIQLAALTNPNELRVAVAASPDRTDEWKWVAWLPHFRSRPTQVRTVVIVDGATDDDITNLIGSLDPGTVRFVWITTNRRNLPASVGQSMAIGDDDELIVCTTDEEPILVASEISDLAVETVTGEAARTYSMALSPLVPDRPLGLRVGESGEVCDLASILGSSAIEDPATIRDRWHSTSESPSLFAKVASCGGDPVSIDLFSDGPHALIAGMTGSGKSELLRTWITSLALTHAPEKLTFLLIDYKGGSAFGSLVTLPHTVGFITDLDPALADRAVVSLRAELLRRERWLAEVAMSSLAEAFAVPGRPPALVVLVDEFATLSKEIPHFVDELVDVAQRGRSLGIHLVLATQRPHGVVSDSIRANTSLRIALRVADGDDSLDVIGTAEAASIHREDPGAAIIRVGQATSNLVRFAYSSGPLSMAARVASAPLSLNSGSSTGRIDQNRTAIDAAVRSIADAFRHSGVAPPRPPWVEPLPDVLHPETIATSVISTSVISTSVMGADEHDGLRPVVGLLDNPEHQRTEAFRLDLETTVGVVIFGCPGSGRSEALSTISEALFRQYPSVSVYSIGRTLPFAADSVGLYDSERVLRLLRSIDALLDGRRWDSVHHGERTVVFIDDMAMFERTYESINRGEATRILERICREGSTAGVNLVVGASRRIEVDPVLAVGFGSPVVLRVASEDEASLLGMASPLAGPIPAGRGMYRGKWIQFAEPSSARGSGTVEAIDVAEVMAIRSNPIPTCPDPVQLVSATAHVSGRGIWRIPIGVDSDALHTVNLDLSHANAVVAGPRRSGRSTALETIARSFRARAEVVVRPDPVDDDPVGSITVLIRSGHLVGSSPHDPRDWSGHRSSDCRGEAAVGQSTGRIWDHIFTPHAERVDSHESILGEGEREFSEHSGLGSLRTLISTSLAESRPVLVCVDDLPDLLEQETGPQVEELIASLVSTSRSRQIRLVVSGEMGAVSRCYSSALTSVRSGRTGILLNPDCDTDGALLGAELGRRDEQARTAGSGWLVNASIASPVKVAIR